MRLPQLLQISDDQPAIDALSSYFGTRGSSSTSFTGARFDTWDSTGTRLADQDRFTADDLVASRRGRDRLNSAVGTITCSPYLRT